MSSTPGYCSTPVSSSASLTTAGTSRTAPTNTGTIFDPGASGGLCERVTVSPLATTVASTISVFKKLSGVYSFLFSLPLAPQTVTTSGSGAVGVDEYSAVNFPTRFPINCPPNVTLVAMVHDTQAGVMVTGEGGGL